MTVDELAKSLRLRVICGGEPLSRNVTGGYCGDLLSRVMGGAKAGDAWVTIMGNVNAVAVASLVDTACIILAEGAGLDSEAEKKAEENGIAVLAGEPPAFELAARISGLLAETAQSGKEVPAT